MKKKGAGYHHGDLRRALVEATIKLVDARGAEEFTLRAAAKLAGVSDGAPYHHFDDKDSLLAAAAESGFVRLADEMTAAADRCDDEADHCIAMGVAYVLFALRHPSLFRLMFATLPLQRKRHAPLGHAADRASEMVKKSIAFALGDAQPRKPLDATWFGSWAIVHGLSLLAIDGHLGATGRDSKKLEKLAYDSIVTFVEADRASDAPPRSARVPRGVTQARATRSSRPPPLSEPPQSVARPKARSPRDKTERARTAGARR